MNSKIIIAIDAMGGENAPHKNIEGVVLRFSTAIISLVYKINLPF